MRNGIIVGIVLVAILSVYAISRNSKETRPCRKLTQACKAAGFKRGHTPAERRHFYQTCLKPLMETGTVGEIQIDPADAVACRLKWSKRNREGVRSKGGDRDTSIEGSDDA
ncbi:MAG: hypothetical protein KF799_03585 [Bdellovibrionales bacterium]|nr:hypothetical protein [Bdellovibrionales bacterium]